jgi:hypothetical protein
MAHWRRFAGWRAASLPPRTAEKSRSCVTKAKASIAAAEASWMLRLVQQLGQPVPRLFRAFSGRHGCPPDNRSLHTVPVKENE